VRFSSPASLPLGVDLGSDCVSIVASDAEAGGFVVRETRTLDVPQSDAGARDLKIAETVRAILGGFQTRERRCVLAAPASDVVTRVFRAPPGMRRSEAERAAALEADSIVDWSASERLVALDPLPGRPDELLLSIARNSSVERLVAIARASGLRPVAVDVPACVWRRALPGADAMLDCSTDRATLTIFGEPIATTHVYAPRLIDDRLASSVRAAFVDARREGVCDVQKLAIHASKFRYESLEELLRGDGYAIAPVELGGIEAPPWAFAYGLASWSVAPRGLAS
jgi:Tfp pilus assembly PilM family ATPase